MHLIADLAIHVSELQVKKKKKSLGLETEREFLISRMEKHLFYFIPQLEYLFYLLFATKSL